MSMKKKKKSRQETLWCTRCGCVESWSSFLEELERVLREEEFDSFVESMLAVLREEARSSSIPPGVYFRMLLIGYFERIDSPRARDLLAVFGLTVRAGCASLGHRMEERTPDAFVELSRIRNLDFGSGSSRICIWMGPRSSASRGMIDGNDTGVVDATTLEANAALLRSIVRSRHAPGKLRDHLKEPCARVVSKSRVERTLRSWTRSGQRKGRTRSG